MLRERIKSDEIYTMTWLRAGKPSLDVPLDTLSSILKRADLKRE